MTGDIVVKQKAVIANRKLDEYELFFPLGTGIVHHMQTHPVTNLYLVTLYLLFLYNAGITIVWKSRGANLKEVLKVLLIPQ